MRIISNISIIIRKNEKWIEKFSVGIVIVIFLIIFSTVSIHRFKQYASWYYDFGIFYQAIYAVAHGKAPIIDHFINPGNILGDHFHPFIFTLSPFVFLFPKGETILILQTLYVSISGIFIYLIAKELLKKKLEALSILIIYFSFIGLHNALITEFHEITLLPLPLSIFLYAMVKKRKRLLWISLIGVLLVKETTFIIPAWFGFLMAIKNKGVWRKIGVLCFLLSLIYGLVVIKLVIPSINGSGYHYLSDAFNNFKLNEFLNPLKRETMVKTFISYGFLPLFAPEILPPVFLNWWSRFVGANTRYGLGMHYNAEIAVTLTYASIVGWKRIKKRLVKLISIKRIKFILPTLAVVSLFLSTYIYKSPLLLFFNKDFYRHSKNFVFLDQLINKIPENGSVMAQQNLAAKLANRKVFILRDNYGEYNADFIVFDARPGQEPNNFFGLSNFDNLVTSISADLNYQVFYDQGEQKIYQRIR